MLCGSLLSLMACGVSLSVVCSCGGAAQHQKNKTGQSASSVEWRWKGFCCVLSIVLQILDGRVQFWIGLFCQMTDTQMVLFRPLATEQNTDRGHPDHDAQTRDDTHTPNALLFALHPLAEADSELCSLISGGWRFTALPLYRARRDCSASGKQRNRCSMREYSIIDYLWLDCG